MKKALLFMAALCLLAAPAIAGVLDNGYAMVGGGVFGTTNQLEQGKVKGFFVGSGLVPLYWNSKVLARAGFSDLNNETEVENYTGSIMILSRSVESPLINPYAFGALSLTHNANPDTLNPDRNSFGVDGGLGMMWSLLGGRWYTEAGYKNIMGEDSFSIGVGLVFDLGKPAGGK